MTPRSKSNKDKADWYECVVCQLIISSKDVILHNASCETAVSQGLNCQNTLNHGYIKHHVFYAQQVEVSTKGDVIKELPQLTRKSIALLHPSAMKFCHIGIGNRVFLQGNGFEMLAIAWPSQSINPGSISIINNEPKEKNLITVQNYMGQISDAIEITLKIHHELQSNINGEALSRQFIIQNSYFCIKPGSMLNCNFFGEITSATVESISDGINIYNEPNDMSDMMQNLNISITECNSEKMESPLTPQRSRNVQSPMSPQQDMLKNYKIVESMINSENSTKSYRYFCVTLDTKIKFEKQEPVSKIEHNTIFYETIGGLDKELKVLQNQFDLFYNDTEILSNYGVDPPRGILLFGPTGTGKTLILKAVANELRGVNVINLKPSELFSKFYGETERKLKEFFENSVKMAPSLLIIDEIDVICDKGEKSSDLERRIFSSLLGLIDNLKSSHSKVLILATTNRIDVINLALRQPGRFDKEIEIPVPNATARYHILTKQLISIPHNLSKDDIESVSENLHSYTGADIACLIRQAGEIVTNSNNSLTNVKITKNELLQASRIIKPTAMKEVTIEVPKVLWSDIGGMIDVKHRLKQAIEWPLKHPESFKRLGVKAPRGLLMYGPPGCSKTMIAKALATESGLNFLAIKGPELFNKWVGESERAVRELFRKAKAAAPSVIFFDEIDALAGERGSSSGGTNVGNRVLAQLLTEIDGVELLEGVTIIAATNRPDMIDKALLRPGRLDSIIYVPLPDTETRQEILQIQFNKMPIASDVKIDHLVQSTQGYSGAEIVALCQEAGLAALSESLDSTEICASHFEKALNYVKPRTSKETLKFYEEYYRKNNVGVPTKKLNNQD